MIISSLEYPMLVDLDEVLALLVKETPDKDDGMNNDEIVRFFLLT